MRTASWVLSAVFVVGCGSTEYYRPPVTVNPTPRHIDDEQIARAFEAEPQLPERVQVAYLSLVPDRDDAIEDALSELPGVVGTYRIPPRLVTGQGRFDLEQRSAGTPAELDVSQLRLLAARAHADIVVVFDQGWRVQSVPNGWVALNVLLVPSLFTPFLDVRAESYLDAYVIDTRNGYLYAQLGELREAEEDGVTIWSDAGRRMVDEQWATLLEATAARLSDLLAQR